MKQIFYTIILGLMSFDTFCQTDLHIYDDSEIEIPETIRKLTIEKNASLHLTSTLTISDSLIVYGTLYNDGIITVQNCMVDGGCIRSGKPNKLTVNENLTFKQATTTSNDTIQSHIVSFSAQNTYVEGHTNMESGYLETQNLIINDTLEFTGKLGVKTVYENLIVNHVLLCTQNESIKIYGNVINNSTIVNENLNLELYGNNKEIRGKFSFYRIDLENDTTFYTNFDSIAIKETFSGKGVLQQAPNAYLKINAQTTTRSPKIIADAVGNTLEYSRGGTQYLTTNKCYNLILTKNNATLCLNEDCNILNQLTIHNKSFLDCNQQKLTFSNATNECIRTDNNKNAKGIILSAGTIQFDNFHQTNEIHVPLYFDVNTYVGFSITNLDSQHATFTLDSLFNIVTHHGDSSSDTINYEFVNATWHFTSDITKAVLQLEWEPQNELELFDSEFCSVYHSKNKRWISVEPPITKAIQNATGETALNGYFTVGNTQIILPIELEYFTISFHENRPTLQWKQLHNNLPYSIEKSYNGTDFFPIATIQPNTNGLYSHTDITENHSLTLYYRLRQTTLENETLYSNIIYSFVPQTNLLSFDKNNKTLIYNNLNKLCIEIYDSHGMKMLQSTKNAVPIATLPHGTYIIVVKTEDKTFQQKMIW